VSIALVGPTASGKTQVALSLAPDFNAEIVCVDSMTVYRGMDVGTAKPSAAERARVPHHLLDIADPREPFAVAMFQRAAREAVAGILKRGAQPFYVGGSGLYFRAAVDDLSLPPTDPEVRARLQALDASTLQRILIVRDPEAAAFIDPANTRRVVRALEVIEITGAPFSSFRDEWGRFQRIAVAGLEVPAPVLTERARTRAEHILKDGIIDEVRALLADGYREALTASKAIGYPQAIALIEGQLDEEGFVDATVRATLRYARRQLSWFRRDPRVVWFDASELENVALEVRAYYVGHLEGDG
jgi:tRNA dimethylallyltransferase